MSFDLSNRLMADDCSATQILKERDVFDLAAVRCMVHDAPLSEKEYQS